MMRGPMGVLLSAHNAFGSDPPIQPLSARDISHPSALFGALDEKRLNPPPEIAFRGDPTVDSCTASQHTAGAAPIRTHTHAHAHL